MPLRQLAFYGFILAAVPAQPMGYGERLLPAPNCLVNRQTVSASGRRQFCIDVEGPRTSGQKLVVSVTTPRPAVDIVRFGEHEYPVSTAVANHSSSSMSNTIGPLIEIKPFERSCESCDLCPCLGPECGPRCECSCNAMCRLRGETTCAHTAGILTPGRWFVAIDAPGAFTLEATLEAALQLSPGAPALRRTVFPAGGSGGAFASTSEGIAFSDYFYYDPAAHEALRVQIELLHTGPGGGWIDVYVRFGDWPTVAKHDALMRCDPAQPIAKFALQPDRLLNERLTVLIVGQGHAWAQYKISVGAAASLPFLIAVSLAVLVVLVALAALVRLALRRQRVRAAAASAEAKPIGLAAHVRFGDYGTAAGV